MGDKPVAFHDAALAELKSAVTWYFERNEKAAIKFAEEIDDAVRQIQQYPNRWPLGTHSTRKFVLRRFRFLIFYRELTDAIQVLAVSHGHRRPGHWQDRL